MGSPAGVHAKKRSSRNLEASVKVYYQGSASGLFVFFIKKMGSASGLWLAPAFYKKPSLQCTTALPEGPRHDEGAGRVDDDQAA